MSHVSLPRSEHLIVTRAGGQSLHPQWIAADGVSMDYDILVAAYEDAAPQVAHEQVLNLFVAGTKVAGLAHVLDVHRDLLDRYRSIAFIDDDISADPHVLAQCFAVGDALDLKIWQPSLTPDSHFSYAGFVCNPHYKWRFVNFVEMMCPFFSCAKLREVEFLLKSGYESGIDLVWCNVGDVKPGDFAVLDCCPVRHTRPVGRDKEKNGYVGVRCYEDDINEILDRFAIPWPSFVPYACVGRDGRTVSSRLAMLAGAMSLLRSIPKNSHMLTRARSVLVHWKHLLTRRPRNYRITPGATASCAHVG